MYKVSVEDKKEFLRWFLNHYQFKRRESVWILNYLMSHDSMMESLHFVERAQYTPKGMLMSTHCVDSTPFRYYKDNTTSTDAERSFHDIRLNREEDLYITLNFYGKDTCPEWLGVLEENPFKKDDEVDLEISKMADDIIDMSLFNFQVKALNDLIDKSLIDGNRDLFMELSTQKNTLINTRTEVKWIVKSGKANF